MWAAELTIWSRARSEKLTVMSSTTGRSPSIAAPTPMPTIVFSEIGVAGAPLAELLQEPGGDLERPVEDADVLAHEEDRLVALHLLAQRAVEGLAVAHHRHGRSVLLGHVALVLALVHAGRPLVDRVPAAHLVAEDVDVVVERRGRGERGAIGERDRLV